MVIFLFLFFSGSQLVASIEFFFFWVHLYPLSELMGVEVNTQRWTRFHFCFCFLPSINFFLSLFFQQEAAVVQQLMGVEMFTRSRNKPPPPAFGTKLQKQM
jgi:hypothetical protein